MIGPDLLSPSKGPTTYCNYCECKKSVEAARRPPFCGLPHKFFNILYRLKFGNILRKFSEKPLTLNTFSDIVATDQKLIPTKGQNP